MPGHGRYPSRLRTAMKLTATGGSLWLGASLWVWHRQRILKRPQLEHALPALVLGCRPGPRLKRRIEAAVSLYRAGYADQIIISGRDEAVAGANWAVDAGVPKSAILTETDAQNTRENIQFSQSLIPGTHLWIVSCRWHLPRALKIAETLGLTGYPCPVEEAFSLRTQLRCLGREGLSAIHHLL